MTPRAGRLRGPRPAARGGGRGSGPVASPERPYPWRFDAARYPSSYLSVPWDEAKVQAAVLDHLTARGVVAFPVDAGVKAVRAVMRVAGKHTLPAVGRKGVSDLVGAQPPVGRAIFIEVKRPAWLQFHPGGVGFKTLRYATQPTDEQLRFLDDMWRCGATCGVTWGHFDLDWILKPWPLDGV